MFTAPSSTHLAVAGNRKRNFEERMNILRDKLSDARNTLDLLWDEAQSYKSYLDTEAHSGDRFFSTMYRVDYFTLLLDEFIVSLRSELAGQTAGQHNGPVTPTLSDVPTQDSGATAPRDSPANLFDLLGSPGPSPAVPSGCVAKRAPRVKKNCDVLIEFSSNSSVDKSSDSSCGGSKNRPGTSQTMHQPIAMTPQAMHQPIAMTTQAMHQPIAMTPQTMQQPIAMTPQTMHQPIAMTTQAMHQPIAMTPQTMHQPIAATAPEHISDVQLLTKELVQDDGSSRSTRRLQGRKWRSERQRWRQFVHANETSGLPTDTPMPRCEAARTDLTHVTVIGLPRQRTLETDQQYVCCIAYAETPSAFYIILQGPEERDNVCKLTVDMEEYYSRHKVDVRGIISDMNYCVVLLDEEWCRCYIDMVVQDGEADSAGGAVKEVKVFYLDYGGEDVVMVDSIQPLVPQFCELAPLAYLCHLIGVDPANGDTWADTANQMMQELSMRVHLGLTVEDNSSESMGVSLSLPSGASLASKLLERGLAVANTPPPSADTPPPSADTPPPSADTPPPSADTPPPSADTPPPSADTPPPSADTLPPNANNTTANSHAAPSASTSFMTLGRPIVTSFSNNRLVPTHQFQVTHSLSVNYQSAPVTQRQVLGTRPASPCVSFASSPPRPVSAPSSYPLCKQPVAFPVSYTRTPVWPGGRPPGIFTQCQPLRPVTSPFAYPPSLMARPVPPPPMVQNASLVSWPPGMYPPGAYVPLIMPPQPISQRPVATGPPEELTDEEAWSITSGPDYTDPLLAVQGYRNRDEADICKHYKGPPATTCFKKDCKKKHILIHPEGWTLDKKEVQRQPRPLVLPGQGSRLRLNVSHVDNPTHFYVHILHHYTDDDAITPSKEDSIFPKELLKLIKDMNTPSVISTMQPLNELPSVGEMVATWYPDKMLYRGQVLTIDEEHGRAQVRVSDVEYDRARGYRAMLEKLPTLMVLVADYYPDKKLYRAQVLQVDEKGGRVQVRYVDFGNRCWTLLKQVYRLDTEFLLLPFQAVPCCLAGVALKGHADPTMATDALRALIQEKIVKGTVVSLMSVDTLVLELVDTAGFSLAETLLAQHKELFVLAPASRARSDAATAHAITNVPA